MDTDGRREGEIQDESKAFDMNNWLDSQVIYLNRHHVRAIRMSEENQEGLMSHWLVPWERIVSKPVLQQDQRLEVTGWVWQQENFGDLRESDTTGVMVKKHPEGNGLEVSMENMELEIVSTG